MEAPAGIICYQIHETIVMPAQDALFSPAQYTIDSVVINHDFNFARPSFRTDGTSTFFSCFAISREMISFYVRPQRRHIFIAKLLNFDYKDTSI